jgi:hypothetical protein
VYLFTYSEISYSILEEKKIKWYYIGKIAFSECITTALLFSSLHIMIDDIANNLLIKEDRTTVLIHIMIGGITKH